MNHNYIAIAEIAVHCDHDQEYYCGDSPLK
jgi:hypothetical protein